MFFIILLFFSIPLHSSEEQSNSAILKKELLLNNPAALKIELLLTALKEGKAQKYLGKNEKFNEDRSTTSEIQLLKVYQKHQNPLFDQQRLEQLEQKLSQEQKNLFLKISEHNEKRATITKPAPIMTRCYQITLLFTLFFFAMHEIIALLKCA